MKRALVVVDVQNEYFSGVLPITYPQGHFTNILQAMDAAVASDIPLVVVQHTFLQPDKPFFQRDTPSGHSTRRCRPAHIISSLRRICRAVLPGRP